MEMEKVLRELKELKMMRDELDAEIEAAEAAIKAEMGDNEVLVAGAFKATWKPVTSTRIDTTAFKKELPEVAARFTKTTTVRRFMVA